MDNRRLTQADAKMLLKIYTGALSKLAKIARTPEDNAGNYVGFVSKWSFQVTPGIIAALESIANNTTMPPIVIFNKTLSTNPHVCLYQLMVSDYGKEFLTIIDTHGGNDDAFKKTLIEFRNDFLRLMKMPGKTPSSHAQIMIQSPPPPTSNKPKKALPSNSLRQEISYTEAHNREVFLHFQVPYNSKNSAQQIVTIFKQQGMPVEMNNNIITIGPSKGMGTGGAYMYTDIDDDEMLNIEFKNESQRNAFAKLVGIAIPDSGYPHKLSFLASTLNRIDKPTPVSNTTIQHQAINDQVIISKLKQHGNMQRGEWKKTDEKSRWEIGRSSHSGNLALASKHIQIEIENDKIKVFNKHNYQEQTTEGVQYYALYCAARILNLSQSLKAESQDLVNTIATQIEKYYHLIDTNKNTANQEDIKAWLDKIGILGEAISALNGNTIDLDQTAKNYPLCRKGDGFVMTSETTKLLNQVKAAIEEQSQHYQPTQMRP